MFKKENGITLVALVVTIIILLILAGVTLSVAMSDGGLIQMARNSVGEHKASAENEKTELANMTDKIDALIEEIHAGH